MSIVICRITYADIPPNSFLNTTEGAEVRDDQAGYEGALSDDYFTITTNEEMKIKKSLVQFERGQRSPADLNERTGAEGNRELIGYYLMHSNDISSKAKIIISRSYAGFNFFFQSAKLAHEYLIVYSNDWRGWRVLGNVCIPLHRWDDALGAFTNAIRLGDSNDFGGLAYVAFECDRMDVIKRFVPEMLAYERSSNISASERLSMATVLLSYSIKTADKDTFVATCKGIEMEDIVRDKSATTDVRSGCRLFQGEDIDRIRRALSDAEAKNIGTGNNPKLSESRN